MSTIEIMSAETAAVDTQHTLQPKPVLNSHFPSNLLTDTRHSSYLIFRCLAFDNPLINSNLRSLKRQTHSNPTTINTQFMIALPMPDSMIDKSNHDYGSSTSSIITEMGSAFIKGGGLNGNMGAGAQAATDVAIPRMIETFSQSNTMRQATGQTALSNHVSLFKGTQLREQTFRYQFQSRNLQELKSLSRIVHQFKRYSSATATTAKIQTMIEDKWKITDENKSTALKAPPLWAIEERIRSGLPRHFDRFTFYPAVITGIEVNMTPNQQHQSVTGTAGDPHSIELAITFKEMVPNLAEDIDAVAYYTQNSRDGGFVKPTPLNTAR